MATLSRLPNGIAVACDERPGTGLVSMQVSIKSGSLNETPDEEGLTHLTMKSVLAGSKTRSRAEAATAIESKGGVYGAGSDRRRAMFTVNCLAAHAGQSFAVLSDLARNPAFDPAEIEKVKARVGQWIAQDNEDSFGRANDLFYQAAFAGQTVGNKPMGRRETVASFTPEQVRQRHAELLSCPDNIVISFAGDIKQAEAEELAARWFGDLPPAPAPAAPVFSFTGGDLREPTNDDQINLFIGFPAPSGRDPLNHHFTLLQEVLSGGMSTPVFQQIREEEGLVYTAFAGYSTLETSGTFLFGAGTGEGNARKVISTALKIVGDSARNGFTEKEIEKARERILHKARAALEETSNSAALNAEQVFSFGKLLTMEEMLAKLDGITSDDLRRACASLLAEGSYALAGVGPQADVPSPEEIQGMMKAQLEGVAVPPPRAVAAAAPLREAFAQAQATPPGKPKVSVLTNGLRVVTWERGESLAISAWVGAGSDHETPKLNGATHMNEHMMFRGTPTYGPKTIDKIVEGEMAGGLNAHTNKDHTAYEIFNLEAGDAGKAVDIIGEMVFRANLDDGEYSGKINAEGNWQPGERNAVLEEIKMYDDDPESRLIDLFHAAAYPDQSHGRPVLGTHETMSAMTVEDLRGFRDEFYVPRNVVFSAVGPVKHEDFVALLEGKFGHLPAGRFPSLPEPSLKGGVSVLELEKAGGCHLLLGMPGVPNTDTDSYAFSVLAMILGSGSSSRLAREVIFAKGLASNISSGHWDFRNCGLFAVKGVTTPDRAKEVLGAAYGELRRLVSDLGEDELEKAKALIERGLLTGLETNENACGTYGSEVLDRGYAPTAESILAEVRALTVEDVRRVARRVLQSDPALAMVVPEGTDRSLLPDYDEVLALRDGPRAPPSPQPGPAP